MNDQKRNNRRNKAALFQEISTAENRQYSHLPPQRKVDFTSKTRPLDNLIFVGKAYKEPVGNDHIEEILLQRKFIID